MRYNPTTSSLAAAAAVLALALTACGGDSESDGGAVPTSAPPTEAAPETPAADGDTETDSAASVGIAGSRFDPLEISIAVGDTVSFTNTDPFAHTVTANDGQTLSFDSGEFGQDETFEVTFDEAGSFAYFCEIHPTMRASVVVS